METTGVKHFYTLMEFDGKKYFKCNSLKTWTRVRRQ